MNIEAAAKTSTATTKTTETTSSAQNASKDETKSFKQELESVKTQEKTANEANIEEQTKTDAEKVVQANVNQIKNIQNNVAQAKKQELKSKDLDQFGNPIDELTAKIETISNLKTNSPFKTQNANYKIEELNDKNDFCKTMKMDNNDAVFFLNLVQNNQNIQNNLNINNLSNNAINNFNEMKTEATTQAAKVSETLMNALTESMKTNKPFRIDFDNNIAVIMKVDKNGVVSANFIPGDAAVENYLRNNIESLKQNFKEQNLSYNELSYSHQQKQKQQNKNKENKDE